MWVCGCVGVGVGAPCIEPGTTRSRDHRRGAGTRSERPARVGGEVEALDLIAAAVARTWPSLAPATVPRRPALGSTVARRLHRLKGAPGSGSPPPAPSAAPAAQAPTALLRRFAAGASASFASTPPASSGRRAPHGSPRAADRTSSRLRHSSACSAAGSTNAGPQCASGRRRRTRCSASGSLSVGAASWAAGPPSASRCCAAAASGAG